MGVFKTADGRSLVGIGQQDGNEYSGFAGWRDCVIQLTASGATENSVKYLNAIKDYAIAHNAKGESIMPPNLSVWISNNGVTTAVQADDIAVDGSNVTICGIKWDGTAWDYTDAGKCGGGGASSLADLSDVDLTGLAAGDGIIFDGQKFKPAQYFPVYNDPSYIAVGVELDNSELSGLLTGKPFILLDATILDDNGDILTSNDISFVRPTVYDSKLHDFEIFGVMSDDGRNENTGLYYIAYVEMESDGKTIKTVTNRYTNQPLEVTLIPTAQDFSGTYGPSWSVMKQAFMSGRRIICKITGFNGAFFEPSYGMFGTSGNVLCGMMYVENPADPTTTVMFAVQMYVDGTYDVKIH